MSAKCTRVVHIVRRFGPVGGMEKYVYELAKAQLAIGLDVNVVCESASDTAGGVTLHTVKGGAQKPRWLAMLRFSRRVSALVRLQDWLASPTTVIHSHERTAVHQITTFHGPPIASVKSSKRLWFLSPRLWAWLWMEKRELFGGRSQIVVANSETIRAQLQALYPSVKTRLSSRIGWPGVIARDLSVVVSSCPNTVLFVGKEWRRKGLLKAIEAVEIARTITPANNLQLMVVGPDPEAICGLLKGRPWVNAVGWEPAWAGKGGTLIHPAAVEPYGMVVAEAMRAGMKVLVSSESGVAAHYPVPQLSANSPARDWAQDLVALMAAALGPVSPLFSWNDLAGLTMHDYNEICVARALEL
ncbi:glycosyltransferase family 4 protein [Litorivicinus lipolyticus]|uniref:glycosyltransferase family 4 protein n=1 Tax=Litorivicinus lipolyticus TaxID=418701 RepID=UPI003B593F2E